jgi:8-oxo-dGTP pyrophosphatase MutT (NUDIX family)
MIPTLDMVRAALGHPPAPHPDPGAPEAAVALVLTPGLDVLFMLRSEQQGDPWSGHVSFPGGRVEPRDGDARAASIRETREELGLDLMSAEYLGELDPMPTVVGPRLVIRAFAFALPSEPVLRPNGEVASVHRRSLSDLLAGAGRGEMPWTWRGQPMTFPCVDFDGVRLWGLTLRFLDDLLDRLDGRGRGLERPRTIS